jgi:hypothetical protein
MTTTSIDDRQPLLPRPVWWCVPVTGRYVGPNPCGRATRVRSAPEVTLVLRPGDAGMGRAANRVRILHFLDRDEALEAAGLSP